MTEDKKMPLLRVSNLAIDFDTRHGVVHAVQDVNFDLHKGEVMALVGESGSGKSVTAYSILNLLDQNGRIANGSITYDGMDLGNADAGLLAEVRGREIAMIFQNPMSTLNPIRKVSDHLCDMLRAHGYASESSAPAMVKELLAQVEIHDAERVANAYPFELSGGMCQRVMIALALACRSRILIADEPTTGLDVTTQKSIMDLVAQLAKKQNLAVILITHDLGLASQYCDKFIVMEKGKIVEQNDNQAFFKAPEHAYTQKLLAATPSHNSDIADLTLTAPDFQSLPEPEISKKPLLEVHGLRKVYAQKPSVGGKLLAAMLPENLKPAPPKQFIAVNDSSFKIYQGECVGLVGGSGSGKSTTSNMLSRLVEPSDGDIIFQGTNITAISMDKFITHPLRKDIQMVFQDPSGSLNPRHTVFDLIAEPLKRLGAVAKSEMVDRITELAVQVGLPTELIYRLPHQLSGGQKARVGIARAIALEPKLLILDEPTSALDVSVQATVLHLLELLRRKLGLSYLFVSHDLHVVKMLSQRMIVMEHGNIVEQGKTKDIMADPAHPYTQQLLSAIPFVA